MLNYISYGLPAGTALFGTDIPNGIVLWSSNQQVHSKNTTKCDLNYLPALWLDVHVGTLHK